MYSHFATEYLRLKFKVCQQFHELPDDPQPELPVLSIDVGEMVLVKYQ